MAERVPTAAEDAAQEEGLVCPGCGYDLRAATAERCSECGLVIDRVALRTSGFPWAHRREIGGIRAYIRTAWLIIVDSRSIAHEAGRPQNPADARVFRRVTAVLVGVALLTAFLLVVLETGYAAFAADQSTFAPGNVSERWIWDVVVPWSAGATLWPVIPLVLVGLAFHMTGVQRRLFRLRGRPPGQRERAGAIADYAAAPMLLLLPAVLWWCAVEIFLHWRAYPRPWLDALLLPAWLLVAVAVIVSILRIAQWSMRVRHAGVERSVVDGPYLLALWSVGLMVWLLLLPWCAGFLWIVLDSLR